MGLDRWDKEGFRNSVPGELERPRHATEFFAAYASARGASTILDPYAVTPSIAAAVSEAVPGAQVTALSPIKAAIEIGAGAAPEIDWQFGQPWDLLTSLESKFDLVVASPPIGLALRDEPGSSSGLKMPKEEIWKQDDSLLVLCLAAQKLEPGGTLVFLLGERSLPSSGGEQLHEFLRSLGFEMEGSISFRDGLAPLTRVETQASVFSRASKSADLFIARISPSTPVDAVVRNLAKREPGSEAEFGALVDAGSYRGWLSAKASRDLEASLGVDAKASTLGEIALGIHYLKLNRDDAEPDFDNTFYLPQVGVGPARTHVDWTSSDAGSHSVVAVEVDPAEALAEFVVNWLNGPQGKLARSSLTSGAVPRIGRKDLPSIRVPVPGLDSQRRAVELRREVVGLQTELEVLDERIAVSLSQASLGELSRNLSQLREGDDVEAWAGRLPFPVASILKRYVADADDRGKYDRLHFFFEAFAAFLATILLSSARADEATWANARSKLAGADAGRRPLLKQADFGGWMHIGRTLSKHFRRVLGSDLGQAGEDGDSARRDALGVADQRFCSTVLDKEVWRLLDQARVFRNRHKGHGGELSKAQIQTHLQELEGLLGELHERTSRAFDGVQLIQPGESGFDGEAHRFLKAKLLVGAASIFNEFEVSATVPLKADGLYFIERIDLVESAVELVPLVQLRPSPETEENACFFYNAVNRDGDCRFVSYHFAGEAELPLESSTLSGLIKDLDFKSQGMG